MSWAYPIRQKPQRWWPGINRQHPLAQGLNGCWPLWDRSGPVARNVAGTHDIALTGAAWARKGSFDALYFDGVDDIAVANKAVLPTTDFTIVFWEHHLDLEGYMVCDGADINNLFLRRATFGGPDLTWYVGDVNGGAILGIDNTTWHCFGITHKGGNADLWLDGRIIDTLAGSNFAGLTTDLSFGNRTDLARDYKGWLAMPLVYTRCLPAAAMRQIASDPFAMIRPLSIARLHVAAAVGTVARHVIQAYRRTG